MPNSTERPRTALGRRARRFETSSLRSRERSESLRRGRAADRLRVVLANEPPPHSNSDSPVLLLEELASGERGRSFGQRDCTVHTGRLRIFGRPQDSAVRPGLAAEPQVERALAGHGRCASRLQVCPYLPRHPPDPGYLRSYIELVQIGHASSLHESTAGEESVAWVRPSTNLIPLIAAQ